MKNVDILRSDRTSTPPYFAATVSSHPDNTMFTSVIRLANR